jgi:uncharacterized damage-inducible protein DinB
MTELNRIAKLFSDLQHGDCWIGTNFKETLHGVTAATAAKSIDDHTNSIWQLVAHLIYWRTSVINRINGNLNPPPFPDFKLPEELNEANWKQTLQDFEAVYHQLRSTINHFKEENLSKPSPKESQTYYQLIMGCLQHDCYHLGQIIIVRKSLTGTAYDKTI